MNVHQNARLTPRGRVLMMERINGGLPVRRAAADAGVSEPTAHRWLRRWRSGDRDLSDRSSAPRRCPHRLAAAQVERIEELRRRRLTGPSIARTLGLNRLDRLEPRPPVIRYERERPGEMLHLDIKSLGRFARIGHGLRPMDRCLQPNPTPYRHRRHRTLPKTEQPAWKQHLGCSPEVPEEVLTLR
ncbi:MAG: leucine zipper domain-containing protein [Devosia sp.]|nr:leucine zipper domain-containing protein [Devosia sp.]